MIDHIGQRENEIECYCDLGLDIMSKSNSIGVMLFPFYYGQTAVLFWYVTGTISR